MPLVTFEGTPCQKAGALVHACQRPHLGLPLRSLHSQRIGPLASWGLTLILDRSPRDPSQGAWRRNTGDWGPPRLRAGLTLPPRQDPGRKRRQWSFRVGVCAEPSEPLETFEGPPRLNAWAHAPACQHPHLRPPLHVPHSQRIGPAGFLGANPNPTSAPKGPRSKGLALQHL